MKYTTLLQHNWQQILPYFKNKSLGAIVVTLGFIFYASLGIYFAQDYGISWDEGYSKERGDQNLAFLLSGDKDVFTSKNLNRGVSFELVLSAAAEILVPTHDLRQTFILRHRITFISFWIGSVFFFLLVKAVTKSTKYAALGVLMLVITPRIFAHSFYNSKDLTFLSTFIISIYTLYRLLKIQSLKAASLHGAVIGFALGVHFWGIVLIPMTTVFLFLETWFKRLSIDKFFQIIGTTIFSWSLFVFGLWPYSWQAPLAIFKETFIKTSSFSTSYPVLFQGNLYQSTNLPVTYLPTWISITTPILYLVFFLVGSWILYKEVKISPIRYLKKDTGKLIVLLWFWAPVVAVMVKGNNLYDGWRHLFFVYPALIIISLLGFQNLWQKTKRHIEKIVLVAAIMFQFVFTSQSIIKLHPFQNVYFNLFVGPNSQQDYDLDYWGLSYRKGIEYLIAHDTRPTISIYVDNLPGKLNLNMLEQKDQKRITLTENINQADYFITNFRAHPENYTQFGDAIYNVERNNKILLSVFQVK